MKPSTLKLTVSYFHTSKFSILQHHIFGMSNLKILELERKLDKLRISNLEEKVKILTKRISKLEDKEDNFAAGNCVKLKDVNDNRVLEVVHVTPKSVWLRHGNKKPFLKRKYNVEKSKINK